MLFDNGEKIGVATVGSDGKWSFDTGRLSDGDHRFTAKAEFGHLTGKVSKPFKGNVDTKAPNKPGAPDLAANSDTGRSSTDNLTGDRTPTLTGTAEAGAIIAIKNGSAVLGTTIADGTGKWIFTAAALTDGAHSLRAVATDKAGNISEASAPLVVTVDATEPAAPSKPDLAAASDTGSSSSDHLTNDRTPTLTGTAEAKSHRHDQEWLRRPRDNDRGCHREMELHGGRTCRWRPQHHRRRHRHGGQCQPSLRRTHRQDRYGKAGRGDHLGPVTEDNIINLREGDPYCGGDIPITGTVTGDIPDGATVTLAVNNRTYTGTVSGAGPFRSSSGPPT